MKEFKILNVVFEDRRIGKRQSVKFSVDSLSQAKDIVEKIRSKNTRVLSATVSYSWEILL